jgi:hypothetical protein
MGLALIGREICKAVGFEQTIRSPTLLEIRVLQGVFTNTYNKPYPMGFFTL